MPDRAESNGNELLPLQLSPDMTVDDLQQTVSRLIGMKCVLVLYFITQLTSSSSSRLTLQYKICQETVRSLKLDIEIMTTMVACVTFADWSGAWLGPPAQTC